MKDNSNISFYHISRDASDERIQDFFEHGIIPAKGNGYGGQSKGFYVWTGEERADTYYRSLLAEVDAQWAQEKFNIDIRLKEGKAVKIEVPVKKGNVKYPDWQLDSEQHPSPQYKRDRSVLLDMWQTKKDFFASSPGVDIKFINPDGVENTIKKFGWDEKNNCPLIECVDAQNNKTITLVDKTNADFSSRTQAINNFMCDNHADYKADYNSLLIAVASNQKELDISGQHLQIEGIPIKYCSNEPINEIKMTLMQGEVTEKYGKRLVPVQEGEVKYRDYKVKYHEKNIDSSFMRMIELRKKLSVKNKSDENSGEVKSRIAENKKNNNYTPNQLGAMAKISHLR